MNYVAVYHIILFMNYCSFHLSTSTCIEFQSISGWICWSERCKKARKTVLWKSFIGNWNSLKFTDHNFLCQSFSAASMKTCFFLRNFMQNFTESPRNARRHRQETYTQIDQSCMKLLKLNALIRSYWINLIIVWNSVRTDFLYRSLFLLWLAVWNELTNWKALKTYEKEEKKS